MPDRALVLAGMQERPDVVVLRFADGRTLEIAPDAIPPDLPGVGAALDEVMLGLLQRAAARKAAARGLLELLTRRLDSRLRLDRKLCDQGHPATAVHEVLDQAEASGLCSDRLFAAAYCRDVLSSRAVGRLWLEAKLRDRGVAPDLARAVAAEQLPSDRERELALRAASARWEREDGRDRRARARVQRFLISRGFPHATAGAAARDERPRT